MKNTKVVISCGPIPARLDSVKFITNRFKGGLAFKTAAHLIEALYDVTIVKWEFTSLPENSLWEKDNVHIVNVKDVFDYYNWFADNSGYYHAFIMAAAVANLTPSAPFPGKFPSHKFAVGESFDLQFEIAPRAIDIIKKINPRACLIGYKLFDGSYDELIDAARLTQKESKANIVFANTPAEAKNKKYAVMADNTVLPVSFDEHIALIFQAIEAQYFETIVSPLTCEEQENPHIREALATVKMFEQTFKNGFGTVAVPVYPCFKPPCAHIFATTSRGHNGEPVIVRSVDFENLKIYASGKATLNAPTLAMAVLKSHGDAIIVHRHDDDPLFQPDCAPTSIDASINSYRFPGTIGETAEIERLLNNPANKRIKLFHHGDIRILPIKSIDWNEYYQEFPDKYFGTPSDMQTVIDDHIGTETLEIGGNQHVDAKYAYDKFVPAQNAINLEWQDIKQMSFNLIFARNAVNYLSKPELLELLIRCKRFIANTFASVPTEKITDKEAAIYHDGKILHTLRLSDDNIRRHSFYAYTLDDYKQLAYDAGLVLSTKTYGKNSILLNFIRPKKQLYEVDEKGIVNQLSVMSCGIAPAGGILVAAVSPHDAQIRANEYKNGKRPLRTAYNVTGFDYPIKNCVI